MVLYSLVLFGYMAGVQSSGFLPLRLKSPCVTEKCGDECFFGSIDPMFGLCNKEGFCIFDANNQTDLSCDVGTPATTTTAAQTTSTATGAPTTTETRTTTCIGPKCECRNKLCGQSCNIGTTHTVFVSRRCDRDGLCTSKPSGCRADPMIIEVDNNKTAAFPDYERIDIDDALPGGIYHEAIEKACREMKWGKDAWLGVGKKDEGAVSGAGSNCEVKRDNRTHTSQVMKLKNVGTPATTTTAAQTTSTATGAPTTTETRTTTCIGPKCECRNKLCGQSCNIGTTHTVRVPRRCDRDGLCTSKPSGCRASKKETKPPIQANE